MKVIAALLLVLPATLGAAEAGQRRADTAPLGDSRLFIMAAEDRRMKLPADLHTPAIDALRASLDQDAKMLVDLTRSPDPRVQAAAIRALGRYENRGFTATILQYLTTGPTTEVATALAQSLRGQPPQDWPWALCWHRRHHARNRAAAVRPRGTGRVGRRIPAHGHAAGVR